MIIPDGNLSKYSYNKRKPVTRKESKLADIAYGLKLFESFSFDMEEGFNKTIFYGRIIRTNNKEGTSIKIIMKKVEGSQYEIMRIR